MRIIRMRAAAMETVVEAAMMERPAAAWVAAVIETVLMLAMVAGHQIRRACGRVRIERSAMARAARVTLL